MFEIERRLEEKGIARRDIIASAMELYVPHGIDEDEAARRLDAKIGQALDDPNVSSLLLGAILLEDELYWKRKNSEIADDPLSCVALGTGRALEEMPKLKNVLSSMY